MGMRPSGKERERLLLSRKCVMDTYWRWRDAEDTETDREDGNGFLFSPSAERWELMHSCIAHLNMEIFRGL
jgi:hypothetical protein